VGRSVSGNSGKELGMVYPVQKPKQQLAMMVVSRKAQELATNWSECSKATYTTNEEWNNLLFCSKTTRTISVNPCHNTHRC